MAASAAHMTREAALKAGGARVAIDTPMVDGSIAAQGRALRRSAPEEISRDHRSQEPRDRAARAQEHRLSLLRRVRLGRRGQTCRARRPDACGRKQAAARLSPGHPVTLPGTMARVSSSPASSRVDDKYMFTVTDSVANKSGQRADALSLSPMSRAKACPKDQHHLGAASRLCRRRQRQRSDANYNDFKDDGTPPKTFSSTGGWVGITDKYWMAAVIPPQDENLRRRLSGHRPRSGDAKAYQANYRLGARRHRAGRARPASPTGCSPAPRWWTSCAAMRTRYGIARFDNAVDWGWFWFLTQPFFWLLDHLLQTASAISASPS